MCERCSYIDQFWTKLIIDLWLHLLKLQELLVCCIFRPAFGCCARQTLVEIVIFTTITFKPIVSTKGLHTWSIEEHWTLLLRVLLYTSWVISANLFVLIFPRRGLNLYWWICKSICYHLSHPCLFRSYSFMPKQFWSDYCQQLFQRKNSFFYHC